MTADVSAGVPGDAHQPAGPPGPGVFGDLVGQEAVVAELRRAAGAASAVLRGEPNTGMTHAWLFTGPPGSGRSVAARAFAAALLCPYGGCGQCPSCHQVRAGTHADLLLVRPDGLSYGVKQTRSLVLRAAGVPSGGRWQVVLFEDADRATEQAANALLKAIEEPPPRTVWLLCAPSAEELVTTIRSRCRLVVLRTPPAEAIAGVLSGEGVAPDRALTAARAAQGHIGRARRLATDPDAARRRDEVLAVPPRLTSLGPALSAAAALVKAAEAEAAAISADLDEPERGALRRAFGEGSTGKGVAPDRALTAARAAQGHIGRARRLATDSDAARRRDEVLAVPPRLTSLGPALSAAAALVKAAEAEAAAISADLDEPERGALRRAFGEGSTGKGVAKAVRGAAGALRDLEDRQKSRATRLKRDALDRALLDLAAFYRDVLAVQVGAPVDLASAGHESDVRRQAAESSAEVTVRRIQAIMTCRERLELNVAPLLAVEEMTLALAIGTR